MDTASIFYELEKIEKELVMLRKKTADFNKRKKALTASLIETMRQTNKKELSYNGKTINLEERELHSRLSEKKKQAGVINVLKDNGVSADDSLIKELVSVIKGPSKTVYAIKKKK